MSQTSGKSKVSIAKSTFEELYYKTPKIDEKEIGIKEIEERSN